jgi:hypothetical protein
MAVQLQLLGAGVVVLAIVTTTIVTWSDNRPSFTVLGFMAVVAYCRGI